MRQGMQTASHMWQALFWTCCSFTCRNYGLLHFSAEAAWNNFRPWSTLSSYTFLRQLTLDLQHEPNSLKHVSQLSSLRNNLQHLSLDVSSLWESTVQNWGFLCCLTLLTFLQIPVQRSDTGLTAVGSCTALQDLRLISKGPSDPFLAFRKNVVSFAALSQLVQLTESKPKPYCLKEA